MNQIQPGALWVGRSSDFKAMVVGGDYQQQPGATVVVLSNAASDKDIERVAVRLSGGDPAEVAPSPARPRTLGGG